MLEYSQNNLAFELVPLSHALRNGTAGQSTHTRDKLRDKKGTSSLKTLAHKVLQRDRERDNQGTKLRNKRGKSSQKIPSCPTPQMVDFNKIPLAEICADSALTRAFLQKYPIDPAMMKEDVSCPKLGYDYRSKRDCLKCVGDKWCIMPILGNPFREGEVCA